MVGQSHTVYPLIAFKKKNLKLGQGVGAVLLFLLLQCCVLFTFLCWHPVFFFFFLSTFFSFQVFRLNLMTLPRHRLLYAEANV